MYIAESELSQVQDLAAGARGQIAQSLIELYRAIGGGWEMRLLPHGGAENGVEGCATNPGRARATVPEVSELQESVPVPSPAPIARPLRSTDEPFWGVSTHTIILCASD